MKLVMHIGFAYFSSFISCILLSNENQFMLCIWKMCLWTDLKQTNIKRTYQNVKAAVSFSFSDHYNWYVIFFNSNKDKFLRRLWKKFSMFSEIRWFITYTRHTEISVDFDGKLYSRLVQVVKLFEKGVYQHCSN